MENALLLSMQAKKHSNFRVRNKQEGYDCGQQRDFILLKEFSLNRCGVASLLADRL